MLKVVLFVVLLRSALRGECRFALRDLCRELWLLRHMPRETTTALATERQIVGGAGGSRWIIRKPPA